VELALAVFRNDDQMRGDTARGVMRRFACIVGYSGFAYRRRYAAGRRKMRAAGLAGERQQDDIVPFMAMGAAEAGLKAAGIPVATVAIPKSATRLMISSRRRPQNSSRTI